VIIATWNVNSIKARLPNVLAWFDEVKPDVVCFQEIKCEDDAFPRLEFEDRGYNVATHGQKTYNGVAIASRAPLANVARGLGDGVDDPQARLLSAEVHGIRVICAYVPNGASVGSDKWEYKLAWLGRLRAYLERTADPSRPLVVCGDLNVAPSDLDVARPDAWRHTVLCHEEGRAALRRVLDWGLVDAFRHRHPDVAAYSWWDYQRLAFPKGDGLRIDHVLVTAPLLARLRDAGIDRDERKGKLPSDHAPVWIELGE
jgi:exodeoxyribonuclease-3